MGIFIALGVLLLCSAFFSGSETALFSLSKIRVRRLQLENVKHAKLVAQLLSKPRRLIISILIGNMLVNILAASIASSVCLIIFGQKGIGISIVVMTFLILVFGEIAPKVIAIKNSEKIALSVAPYINFLSNMIAPVRKILRIIVDLLTPFFSKNIKTQKGLYIQVFLGELGSGIT